ncbi:SUKH-3 domain-containing protein [Micromonospora violae]|uniref:SUKH-3 domain-containing protein n=1 Tax=Micromonospora violae TaxID=1278207 RepID=UPI0033FAFE0A
MEELDILCAVQTGSPSGTCLHGDDAWIRDAPAEVSAEFRRGGWYPGRSVDVSAWTEEIASDGFLIPETAIGIWRSLGGLEFGKSGRRCSLLIDPTLVQGYQEAPFTEWPLRFGQRFCPIGEWDHVFNVFVGSKNGVLISLDSSVDQWFAGSPAVALHQLLSTG